MRWLNFEKARGLLLGDTHLISIVLNGYKWKAISLEHFKSLCQCFLIFFYFWKRCSDCNMVIYNMECGCATNVVTKSIIFNRKLERKRFFLVVGYKNYYQKRWHVSLLSRTTQPNEHMRTRYIRRNVLPPSTSINKISKKSYKNDNLCTSTAINYFRNVLNIPSLPTKHS